jgi:hypothetical protein
MTVVRHCHRFGKTLRFVVNTANTDRIHVTPVGLFLRVLKRIAVTLRRGRCEELRVFRSGKAEHFVSAECANLEYLNRYAFEIDRARRTGEVENEIDVTGYVNVFGDIVFDKPEPIVSKKMLDVCEITRDEIVEADHLMPLREHGVTQMRTDESSAARYDYTHVHPFLIVTFAV